MLIASLKQVHAWSCQMSIACLRTKEGLEGHHHGFPPAASLTLFSLQGSGTVAPAYATCLPLESEFQHPCMFTNL